VNPHQPFVRAARWCLLLACVLAAAPAVAGDDRSKWWVSAEGRAELGISEAQSRELEAVFQSLLPRLRAEKQALDREDATLTRLMAEGADETTLGPAIDRVEAARSAVSKTRTWMLVRMHRVLSPEQRVKLHAMHERRERERRDHARGGAPRP
jgi:Spy/CpxP family protein refolding chaperone